MFYNDLIAHELKSLGASLVGFADLSESDAKQRRGYQISTKFSGKYKSLNNKLHISYSIIADMELL